MKTEQIAMYAAIFAALFIILRWRTTRESELLDKSSTALMKKPT